MVTKKKKGNKGSRNLIPTNKANRSKEEAREISRKGGIKSGETRRRRKTIREYVNILLNTNATKEEIKEANIVGLNEEIKRSTIVACKLYELAKNGNPRAIEYITEIEKQETDNSQQVTNLEDSKKGYNDLIDALNNKADEVWK